MSSEVIPLTKHVNTAPGSGTRYYGADLGSHSLPGAFTTRALHNPSILTFAPPDTE
jgi:hypothetical protein